MSLRLPRNLAPGLSVETGASVLDYEIAGEKAAALGRAGEQVERTLKALRALAKDDEARPAALQAASDAVYGYFIQRELSGFAKHDQPIKHYGIPGEILARLGAS